MVNIMNSRLKWKHELSISYLAVLISVFVLLMISSFWDSLGLHVPGEPHNRVDFTYPVDGIFYLRNAENGYQFSSTVPTSLWFHPLVAWLTRFISYFMPSNIAFWGISVVAGGLGLFLSHRYLSIIAENEISPHLLLLLPFLPGGLSIGTGNAEFVCLVFTALTLLSIVKDNKPHFTILWGSLAILTKPNALYLVPMLAVYAMYSAKDGKNQMLIRSVLGLITILVVWFTWILFVDVQSGMLGTYWTVREMGSAPLHNGALSFFQSTVRVLLHTSDTGEKLNYIFAFVIPLVHIWILLFLPLQDEVHRIALFAGIIAVLGVTFAINNPNKVIVYVMAFPGTSIIGMYFLSQCFTKIEPISTSWKLIVVKYLAGIAYITFCVISLIFYIIGTPFQWYY